MMGMILFGGEHMNILTRATLGPTPAAHAKTPVSELVVGTPGRPFLFSGFGAGNVRVRADLAGAVILNGGLENWTGNLPDSGWAKKEAGASTVTKESTLFSAGAAAAKLTSVSDDDAFLYFDFKARSGDRWNVSADLRGDGAVNTRFRIRCLETDKYLTAALAWTSTATDFANQVPASYDTKTATFVLEDYAATLRHLVTLRLEFAVGETGAGYVDEVYAWPSWDWVSVHGHNLGTQIIIRVDSADTSLFNPVDSATMTRARPTFYSSFSSFFDRRWMRLVLFNDNFELIQIGELVVGQKRTLSEGVRYGGSTEDFSIVQIASDAFGGDPYRINIHEDEQRTYRLGFRHSFAERDELLNELRRAKWGAQNMILVPDDTRANPVAILARSQSSASVPQLHKEIHEYEIVFQELPFGIVGL